MSSKAVLYLIHGFIAFGKTTFAKKLATEQSAIRLNHDEIMIERYGTNPPKESFAKYREEVSDYIINETKKHITNKQSVILDHGFWSRTDRDKYRALAKELSVESVLYSINCDLDVAKERCLKRTELMLEGALFIDENAFNLLLEKYEALDDDEQATIINN